MPALTGHQRIQALVRVGQQGAQFVERVSVRQPVKIEQISQSPDDGADAQARGVFDKARWIFMLAIPFQRPCPRAKAGSPRLPGDPSRDSAPFSDPGRPVAPRQSRRFRCCPHTLNNEGVVNLPISRLDSAASSPAVYASRRALPHAMQDSLPAGGLRLCRAGVEPAGSRRKVSDHLILLSRSLPGAISVRSSRDGG